MVQIHMFEIQSYAKILILLLVSFTLSASPAGCEIDPECEKTINKIIACGATNNFIDLYRQICMCGNILRPNDIDHYYDVMGKEAAETPCLGRYIR